MNKSQIRALEEEANAYLAALPASERPEMNNRSRVQSVAYLAGGSFEFTDRDGHVESAKLSTVREWLAKR